METLQPRVRSTMESAPVNVLADSVHSVMLSSCSNLIDKSDADLDFELLYLETLLAARPIKRGELLAQLGALGEDMGEEFIPAGVLNFAVVRRQAQRVKRRMSLLVSRMTAAMLVFFTSLPLFSQQAKAQEAETLSQTFMIAEAPLVRVVDAATNLGIAGVQIKTMDDKLLGVTDATGQATLTEGYQETDLLSLEKDGYQMYLLERAQISSRNIVSMKPMTAKAAKAPTLKAPTAPKVAHVAGAAPRVEAPKAPAFHPPMAPPKPAAHPILPKVAAKPVVMAPSPEASVHEAHPDLKAPVAKVEAPAPHHEVRPALVEVKPSPKVEVKPSPKVEKVAEVKHEAHPGQALLEVKPSPKVEKVAELKPSPKVEKMPEMAHEAPEASAVAPVAAPKPVETVSKSSGITWSSYAVHRGDTLSALAFRYLGSAQRWPEILKANETDVRNPHLLRIGQMLKVPQGQPHMYRVRSGDCLYTIASRHMGNGAEWMQIYRLNKGRIRNPHNLSVGQMLLLPM